MDTDTIRTRIIKLGWSLKELPVRKNHPDTSQRHIAHWKIIAFKGAKSIESTGATLDVAMENIGKALGVIG
jgi:hypothetical protein